MPDLEKFFGSEDWNMDFVRAMLAEFIGSFFFVLIGILCTSFKPTDTEWQFASPVQVAFALGCITFSISHALGRISGAHLSPMVSLGLFLICGMSVLNVIGYIFAQFLGGLAAIGIISLSLNEEMYKENRTIRPMMGASYLEICIVEGLASFIWIVTVIVTTERRHEDAYGNGSFYIGLTVFGAYLIAMIGSGGGVNPVRSVAASILENEWENRLCYWVGPIAGAILAAIIYYCCSGTLKHRHIYRLT